MKQKDIVINGEYMTLVGINLIRVRVIAGRAPIERNGKHMTFLVRRSDNGTTLPKWRTAAALRPIARTS